MGIQEKIKLFRIVRWVDGKSFLRSANINRKGNCIPFQQTEKTLWIKYQELLFNAGFVLKDIYANPWIQLLTGVGMRCPLCKDFALLLKNQSKVL